MSVGKGEESETIVTLTIWVSNEIKCYFRSFEKGTEKILSTINTFCVVESFLNKLS